MLLKLPLSPLQSPWPHRAVPFVRFFSSLTNTSEEEQIIMLQKQESTIFHIINSSSASDSMIRSLESSGIQISNTVVDRVLKRVRFSHGNPLKALAFFSIIGKHDSFTHTSSSYDTMLYILGRGRRFPEMWDLLREMKRTDRTLITMRTIQIVLARIAKVCSVRQTVESFHKFRRLVLEYNTDCFNALLRTLSQEKSMGDARNVYHSLKHEFRPNLQTFNILLAGWKSSNEAEGFFKEMEELGVDPDLVSYNCLVDVYCKNREMDKAYKVLDEMHKKEFSPDVFTYTSMIGGLGLIGQPDKAKEILKDMIEMGCQPDVAAFNAAIRNYCIAKRIDNAFALMKEMEVKGLKPNPTSYNLFFRCFYWANELENSWQLYKKMRREECLPNTQSCMFLMRLCRKQEKVGLALELWNDMLKNGFGSLALVSDVLFDLLCDLGKLDEAEKCFVEMVDMGQMPSCVSFRRIKVLMELAKRHDSIINLRKKMSLFAPMMKGDERQEELKEMPLSVIQFPDQ